MNKVTFYLKELSIVTIGVLVALLISNVKENRQAKKYLSASIEAVKNEIEANYIALKSTFDGHSSLQDTLNKYIKDPVVLSDLIYTSGGLRSPSLKNSGLDFYTKNEISAIDFEMMSLLLYMKSTTALINLKMEKLIDYLYPNLYVDSEESKMLAKLYLRNLISSERQLIESYELYMDTYMGEEEE